MTTVSRHAAIRAKQRSIPPVVFEWLEQYGEEQFDGRGGVVMYFSRNSRRRMEMRFGRRFVAENRKYLNHYMVESARDGAVITTGVRSKRIRRR